MDVDRARHTADVRRRCRLATAAGARRVSGVVLDGGPDQVGPYVTWSGARLCCAGTTSHGHIGVLGASGVPLLVIGPAWRSGGGDVRRVVAGLHGPLGSSGPVATVAALLAVRLGVDLVLIEVVPSRWRALDIPACAHVRWVAHDLPAPAAAFDTVAADRSDEGLGRFVERRHHPRARGGDAPSTAARRGRRSAWCDDLLGRSWWCLSRFGPMAVYLCHEQPDLLRPHGRGGRRRAGAGRARPLGVPSRRRRPGVRHRHDRARRRRRGGHRASRPWTVSCGTCSTTTSS